MWTIKVGDRLPSYEAQLRNPDDTPFDLAGYTVRFRYRPRGTHQWVGPLDARVVTASDGRVAYDWAAGETANAGIYQTEWVATDGDGRQITFPSDSFGEFHIFAG